MELKDKHILLIALPGYCDGILKKMAELGADVDLIIDKPNEGFICKTFGRYKIGIYQKIIHNYYKEQLQSLKHKSYDYILSIRGEYTPIDTLKLLKVYYPHSRLILYMWDGLGNASTKGIEKKWPYYDQVYTFDRIDFEANKDKLSFLPLYYYEDYLPKNIPDPNSKEFTYDLCFIGTGHDDRIRIIKDAIQQCKEKGFRCFSYYFMPHHFVFFWYKLCNKNFKDVNLSDVEFKKMSFEKLYKTYAESKCIMDVESIGQHGLTMRSIEILGLKRKLITTNKDIANYDFYNENNILILDRKNPVINMEFFSRPYEVLDQEIYKKYSLRNWILEIIN